MDKKTVDIVKFRVTYAFRFVLNLSVTHDLAIGLARANCSASYIETNCNWFNNRHNISDAFLNFLLWLFINMEVVLNHG